MPLSIQTRQPAAQRVKKSIGSGSCNRKTSIGSNLHQTLLSESRYAFSGIVNVRLNLLHQRIRVYQLVDGYAECFGIELATGISYLFGGECKAVIYTHSGCTLEMSLSLDARPSLQGLTISPLTCMGSL